MILAQQHSQQNLLNSAGNQVQLLQDQGISQTGFRFTKGKINKDRMFNAHYKAWHWEELLNRLLDLATSIALAMAIARVAIPARRQVYRLIRCTLIQTDRHRTLLHRPRADPIYSQVNLTHKVDPTQQALQLQIRLGFRRMTAVPSHLSFPLNQITAVFQLV